MMNDIENRETDRRRVLKRGEIVFNAGRSTIDCTVRNFSSKGARLEVASVVGIPNTFDLLIAGNSKQPCRIAWRRLKEIGVSFETAV
jgi:hypothetical protein